MLICDVVLPPAGATLSQLSDSGQTLSEDSGVDIAEAGGLIRDGSPRPSKSQQGKADHARAHVAPPGPLRPVRAPTLGLACIHTLASISQTCLSCSESGWRGLTSDVSRFYRLLV